MAKNMFWCNISRISGNKVTFFGQRGKKYLKYTYVRANIFCFGKNNYLQGNAKSVVRSITLFYDREDGGDIRIQSTIYHLSRKLYKNVLPVRVGNNRPATAVAV